MDSNSKNQIVKMLYLITQIGFTMLVTIFICIGMAFAIDKLFGVNLMVLFIVLGVAAGFKASYMIIQKFVSFENPDDEYIKLMSNKEPVDIDGEDDELHQ